MDSAMTTSLPGRRRSIGPAVLDADRLDSERKDLTMSALLARLGIALPIIQAPMAGVSTPAMAAAVSNASWRPGLDRCRRDPMPPAPAR